MTGFRTWLFILVPVALIAIVAAIVAHVPYRQQTASDAAAVVLTVSAASVGIERAIELFWTAMGLLVGSIWPLNVVGKQTRWLTASLDESLKPLYADSALVIEHLQTLKKLGADEARKAQEDLANLQKFTSDLKTRTNDSARLQTYTRSVADAVNQIQVKYTDALTAATGELDYLAKAVELSASLAAAEARAEARAARRSDIEAQAVAVGASAAARMTMRKALDDSYAKGLRESTSDTEEGKKRDAVRAQRLRAEEYVNTHDPAARVGHAVLVAGQAVDSVGSFIATFKDNPGKRLLSLELGALAGLAIAGLLGVDVFKAVLSPDAKTDIAFTWPTSIDGVWNWIVSAPFFGVAATGLLLGLGSNPTHEVIGALQQYKIDKKAAGAPTGSVTGGETVSPDALDGIVGLQAFRSGESVRRPTQSARIHFR
jgi:hypothetical protein